MLGVGGGFAVTPVAPGPTAAEVIENELVAQEQLRAA